MDSRPPPTQQASTRPTHPRKQPIAAAAQAPRLPTSHPEALPAPSPAKASVPGASPIISATRKRAKKKRVMSVEFSPPPARPQPSSSRIRESSLLEDVLGPVAEDTRPSQRETGMAQPSSRKSMLMTSLFVQRLEVNSFKRPETMALHSPSSIMSRPNILPLLPLLLGNLQSQTNLPQRNIQNWTTMHTKIFSVALITLRKFKILSLSS